MREYEVIQVDVFTDRPLSGNPLAVLPKAAGLSDAEMLAIAREMNLSETTFVLPPRDPTADYVNRIFTPGGEIPFAGHPSIGTAYVTAMTGQAFVKDGVNVIRQEVGIGVLPIEIHVKEGLVQRVVMTQGAPQLGDRVDTAKVADALGVAERDITETGLAPQVSSTGMPSLQIPLRSLDLVRNLKPNPMKLAPLLESIGPEAGAYVFSFETESDADLHARGFFPLVGISEDPATGSAAGACGAYLAANGRLPEKEWFTIEQGIEIHHPSRIEVGVAMEGGTPTAVRVAGNVAPIMRGTLVLEDEKPFVRVSLDKP
jgi:trans-2,3-dihydro-3-hydroxyanthranilate isomerase